MLVDQKKDQSQKNVKQREQFFKVPSETRRGRNLERNTKDPIKRTSIRLRSMEESEEKRRSISGSISSSKCIKCMKKVVNGVHCKICLAWFHFSCENTTLQDIDSNHNKEDDDYICNKCNSLRKEKVRRPPQTYLRLKELLTLNCPK